MCSRSVRHPASTCGVTAYMRAFMIRVVMRCAHCRSSNDAWDAPLAPTSSGGAPEFERPARYILANGLFDCRIERRRHVVGEELLPDAGGALRCVLGAGV